MPSPPSSVHHLPPCSLSFLDGPPPAHWALSSNKPTFFCRRLFLPPPSDTHTHTPLLPRPSSHHHHHHHHHQTPRHRARAFCYAKTQQNKLPGYWSPRPPSHTQLVETHHDVERDTHCTRRRRPRCCGGGARACTCKKAPGLAKTKTKKTHSSHLRHVHTHPPPPRHPPRAGTLSCRAPSPPSSSSSSSSLSASLLSSSRKTFFVARARAAAAPPPFFCPLRSPPHPRAAPLTPSPVKKTFLTLLPPLASLSFCVRAIDTTDGAAACCRIAAHRVGGASALTPSSPPCTPSARTFSTRPPCLFFQKPKLTPK